MTLQGQAMFLKATIKRVCMEDCAMQFGCKMKNKSSGKWMFKTFSQSCSWITPHPDRLLRPPWRTGPAWCSLPLESTSLWKCPVRGGVWPAAPCTHQEVGLLWPPPPYWVWINRMAPGEKTRSKTKLKDREMAELTWYALPTFFCLVFLCLGWVNTTLLPFSWCQPLVRSINKN